MKYEDFLTQLENCIRSKKGKEVKIHVCHIMRNNGEYTDSISVLLRGEKSAPAVGLALFYRQAVCGTPIEKITDQILGYMSQCRKEGIPDLSLFHEYESVCGKIVCRIVHYQKNRELLAGVPYTRFLDLAVIYYYLDGKKNAPGVSVMIRNEHLGLWNVTKDEIHERALANTPVLLPYEFDSMVNILRGIAGAAPLPQETEDMKHCMYVLSNRRKMFGAVHMIYPDILEMIAGFLRDDYYVLPGSVHECIIVPASTDMRVNDLQQMVKEVNQTQVSREEFLSDSVYRYLRGSRSLTIAASGE